MLTVVLVTCARNQQIDETSYAVRTLDSTLSKMYVGEPIAVHIADDTKDGALAIQHVTELRGVCDKYQLERVSVTMTGGQGYGANYNQAMQVAHQQSDVILPLEDDWELVQSLDVSPVLSLLRTSRYGCVRFGYLGYTQQLKGAFFTAHGLHWIHLDHLSAEPHVFAGHPRIETVEWARTVGPWPIGLAPGDTEWEVAHRKESRVGVVWPISLTRPEGELFQHIGTVASTDEHDA